MAGPTLEQIAESVGAGAGAEDLFERLSGASIGVLLAFAVLALVALAAIGLLVLGAALAAVLAAGAAGVFLAARTARARQDARSRLDLSKLAPDALPAEPPAGFALSVPGATPPAAAADPAVGREFGDALRGLTGLLTARTPPAPERPRFDQANAHAKVMAAIVPRVAYPRRAASLIRVGDRSIVDYIREVYGAGGAAPPVPPGAPEKPPSIKPVMAYPDIKEPMYRPLDDLADDLLVPNLGLVPPNTVTLMLTNPPFIEAYMAGVNHEFARELLWREYPTDCRGSPFRQFWDVSRVPTPGLAGAERARRLKDIKPLHEWVQAGSTAASPSFLSRQNANPLRGFSGDTSCWRCAAIC